MARHFVISLFFLLSFVLHGKSQVEYPYPVHYIPISISDSQVSMAYMDIPSSSPVAKTMVLLHGKNFNGYYWKELIPSLTKAGFRVIVPDQVGWGQSAKPLTSYSFHWLASNTSILLDSLHIDKVILLGHSMGGMLAARFAMQYPQRVEKMVLENPIGLEDYKRFVPYQATDSLTLKEKNATYESYKKYQQSYYPVWKPEYEQYVAAQAAILKDPAFATIARVNALTYQMTYEQPVCYEWDRIKIPTLLIIGLADRTVVGKDRLTSSQKELYGQYPLLGKKTKQQISNAMLAELPGVGHIPHIQKPLLFQKHLLDFVR
jgi:pimeloyl-ACP methyl ester carboxylesterase